MKYYRVLKDLPAWRKGAILEQQVKSIGSGYNYVAISDIWNTEAADECGNYYETETIIEESPLFFERVYDVKVLGKIKYLAKEAALAAYEKLHKA